ncbi:MAG: hypothetical protein A2W35_14665 [Chloroflexi bacterium RBG_16_57_11]|nr:MAG: hypothetical protein A2W35_14665 [Chloroflexi bacterium RBG_16_57_11]
MAGEPEEKPVEMTQPIVIELGKRKAKDIKDLKNGKGKVWDDVYTIVEEVKEMLGEDANSKVILPVIMIYQKKPKRQSLNRLIFPNFK